MDNSTTTKEKSGSKNIIFANISLFIISLLCALLIGEGSVRLMLSAWPFQSNAKVMPYLTEKDISLRWRFSSQKGRNSLGLRNREITQKGENTVRIMFLGDSLIWSGATSAGKLYTEVVEENLNNVLNTDKKIEVVNAGIPGYTTYQELEFLNLYGFDMQPDLVILGFVFNDVYYKYLHRPTDKKIFAAEPKSYLNRFNVRTFPGMLFAGSYLAHEIAHAFQRIYNKLYSLPYYSFDHRDDFYLAWKSYGWDDADMLIGKMHQQLSQRSIPLVIAIFPVSDQVDDKYLSRDRDYVLYPQSRIKLISEMYGIPYIDLTDALYQGGGRKLFSDYLHLKPEGNDIVATEFTRYLSDNYIHTLN